MSEESTSPQIEQGRDPQIVRRKARKVQPPMTVPRTVSQQRHYEEKKDEEGNTKQDLWKELEQQGLLVPPPYDPILLASFPESSSELGQDIEAMEINVSGFGFRLELPESIRLEYTNDEGVLEPSDEILEEHDQFEELIKYGNWSDESFTYLRRQQRRDYEAVGYCFLELIQNRSGDLVGFQHAPAHRMRLARQDPEFTTYSDWRVVGQGKRRRLVARRKKRRFRRYIQIRRLGDEQRVVWFKEFGDPRDISSETGKVIPRSELAEHWRNGQVANPMRFKRLYSPRTPYGVPRYMGNLLSIVGTRAAEEINYTTFANNNIPSMAVTVAGGQLTDETIQRITSFTTDVIQGDNNWSKFLVIEAEADEIGAYDRANTTKNVQISIQPLTREQHSDALFKEYTAANADKTRRSFRLAPIIVGSADSYDKGTAETSKKLNEEQVFVPERAEEDWDWNKILVSQMMKFHVFVSNGPNVTVDQDLIKIMAAAERSGAMTPRLALAMVRDIMGKDVPGFDETKIEGDVPFTLQMAEKVKNQADAGLPEQQTAPQSGPSQETVDRNGRGEGSQKSRIASALKAQEVLYGPNRAPAVSLGEDAVDVLDGVLDSFSTKSERDVDGIVFALVDDFNIIGFVELSASAGFNETDYSFVSITKTSSPIPHSGVDGDEVFVESVEVGSDHRARKAEGDLSVAFIAPVPDFDLVPRVTSSFPFLDLEPETDPHITLLFMGRIPLSALQEVEGVLREVLATESPVEMSNGLLTAFPNGDDGTPVIVTFKSRKLARIHGELIRRLAHLVTAKQFPVYTPHLTVGYHRGELSFEHGKELEAFDVSDVDFVLREVKLSAKTFDGKPISVMIPFGGTE